MIEVRNTQQVDKPLVAKRFGSAAQGYDQAAGVQHISGNALLELVESCDSLMDLGCGTGFHLADLSAFSPQLIAVDLSQQMLEAAAQRKVEDCQFIQADVEQLTAFSPVVDGIFSNMMLQWSNSLATALQQCYQSLKPGGYMVFTTLVDGTLDELKQSWQQVDHASHVNQFLTAEQVSSIIDDSAFEVEYQQTRAEVVFYDDALGLLRDLKGVGANQVNQRQHKGFTGKQAISALREAYRGFALADGRLPATYQVYYSKLRK